MELRHSDVDVGQEFTLAGVKFKKELNQYNFQPNSTLCSTCVEKYIGSDVLVNVNMGSHPCPSCEEEAPIEYYDAYGEYHVCKCGHRFTVK